MVFIKTNFNMFIPHLVLFCFLHNFVGNFTYFYLYQYVYVCIIYTSTVNCIIIARNK